ncbi:MAG: haloacid dehalogenase-like hydrolase [Bacilli bacterium]|nr:haloacid dehalogenase-like hydrolase [Bacilli bacterium]
MINAYDFDKTIYDGDSSLDFYIYSLKRNKKVLLQLPYQFIGLILYILKIIDKTRFKEYVFSFLKRIDNVDEYVKDFWNEKQNKIKEWYLKQKKKDDVIISASPEFLLKPLEKKLGIKIIASKVDKKTGKFNSKNCHDYEKIKRYEEKYTKKIKEFYSDSISADKAMFEYSEEAYLVTKDKVERINVKDYCDSLKTKKAEKLLFIFSLLFCFIMGLLISYNYNIKDNLNLLFDSDVKRVYGDAAMYFESHYRTIVHPLFVILIQPIISVLTGFTKNNIISYITISSVATSISVLYIYKILNKIKKDNKQNIILSLIYLFSFANIIFTSIMEVYNIAALFLIITWYYYINRRDSLNSKYSYAFLIILGALNTGITITNVVIYFIILGVLFISKKMKFKNIIKVIMLTGILVVLLNGVQHLFWRSSPFILNNTIKEEKQYAQRINIDSAKNVINNNLFNSFISSKTKIRITKNTLYSGDNYVIDFCKQNITNTILLTLFYSLIIFLMIRNFKKELYLNIGLSLALLFNIGLHLIYGNSSNFLYSLHFNYLVILLLGINLLKENNKKICKFSNIYLLVFLLIEIIVNFINLKGVIGLINDILDTNILIIQFGLTKVIILEIISIATMLIACLIIYKLIKLKKQTPKKEKNIIINICIGSLLLLIHLILLVPYYFTEKDNNFADDNIKRYLNSQDKISYINKTFKKYYKDEINEFKKYKNEMIELANSNENIELQNIIEEETYYFGFGSRRKLLYRKNSLIDINTKEVLYEFEEKEKLIIPNLYTVIIQTKDNNYIKIKEDNKGIHYALNGKDEIIEGTDKEIKLFDFSNQKYQNIKKVLYGEILFNIKDNIIYPNIIVYDKPWYRDAAITSMVLRQTNNTDLINDWINSINELYDNNNGYNEPDNLGEILYLLSLSEERNEDLIDRIETEAERLATSNPNGYYIYGQTDFSPQHLYQNLWYKLGIEKVGRTYHFDISKIPEDDYSKGAWWSNYIVKGSNNNLDVNYPYLSYAVLHKQKVGKVVLNYNLYPLSWERNASQAKYENYLGIDNQMNDSKTSPIHSWSASELLLYILDETNDLNYDSL